MCENIVGKSNAINNYSNTNFLQEKSQRGAGNIFLSFYVGAITLDVRIAGYIFQLNNKMLRLALFSFGLPISSLDLILVTYFLKAAL